VTEPGVEFEIELPNPAAPPKNAITFEGQVNPPKTP
jgi:hypothetical protein